MIRIRYKDLSPGLHGKAERHGNRTIVYLLPGLSGRQRKAALRRLRQEASRGCGPPLPCPQLMLALGASRAGQGLRSAAAVIRLHPAASVLPVLAAGALMALFVLASVSVRIVHLPGGAPAGSSPATGAAGPVGAVPSVPGPAPGPRTGSGGAGGSSGTGSHGGSRPRLVSTGRSSATSGLGSGAGKGSATPTRSGGSSAPATGTGTGLVSPTGAGTGSPADGSQPTGTGSPAPSPSSAASPSSSGGGTTEVCVGLGSLGTCIGL